MVPPISATNIALVQLASVRERMKSNRKAVPPSHQTSTLRLVMFVNCRSRDFTFAGPPRIVASYDEHNCQDSDTNHDNPAHDRNRTSAFNEKTNSNKRSKGSPRS